MHGERQSRLFEKKQNEKLILLGRLGAPLLESVNA
jgi:hypothetical protein